MDFSKFDNRGPAESGQRYELLNPSEKEGQVVKSGDDICAVIVRGSTARSVQAEARKRQKIKMSQAAKAKGKEEEARVMEDIHQELCDTAFPLIAGFENIDREGRPLTAEPDDVKWFLDLTFPIMGVREDEDGLPILTAEGDPVFEMKNNPFSRQVAEFSAKLALELGNGKTG